MSGKQGLKLRFERMGLLLKAMKFNSFLPLIFIDLLVPLVNFAVYRNKGASVEFTTTVFSMIHIFVPLFSCWWVVFSLRFFYDEKGSEILFVNSDRNKLTDVFILFFIMIVNVSLTFIPYYFFAMTPSVLSFRNIILGVIKISFRSNNREYFLIYIKSNFSLS